MGDSLSDLDFPFETECIVGVSESDHVFLNLDLPEIEDVISEHAYRVLKNGTIRQTARKRSQRFREYASLVAGLAVLMAATAFAAAPTVNVVSLGAYTQRKKRGQIVDDYVIDMSVTRDQFENMDDPQTADPIPFILRCGANFRQKQSLELSSLDPPKWACEFATSNF